MNRFDDGIQLLRDAVKIAADKAPFLHSLGVAYLESERFSEAIRVLKQAVQLMPENETYLLSLIQGYEATGNTSELRVLQQRLKVIQEQHALSEPSDDF